MATSVGHGFAQLQVADGFERRELHGFRPLAQHLGQDGGQRIGGRLAIARGQRAIDADDAVALRALAPEAELQQRFGAHASLAAVARGVLRQRLRIGGGAETVVSVDGALDERLVR